MKRQDVYIYIPKEHIVWWQKDNRENIIHVKDDSMKCTEFLSPLKQQ